MTNILNGYRGNKNTKDGVAAIVNTYDQTIMAKDEKIPPATDEKDSSVEPIVSKTKTRVNRKGELIEKTKWKNTDTGRKGGSKKVTGPTTVDYDADVIAGALFSSPGSDDETTTPTPPVVTKTEGIKTPAPPDSGETPPSITPPGPPSPGGETKPVKTKGWRESYTPEVAKKWEGEGGFAAYKAAGLKWKEKQKGTTKPPDESSNELIKMKPRGITPIEVNTPPVELTKIESDRKVEESSWEKGKNKIKKTKTTKPPYNPRRPGGEYSTTSSTSCGKGGCIGPGGIEGMFSSDFTSKDRRQINKQLRKSNRAGRQTYREEMGDARWHNRQKKKQSSSNTAYRQHRSGLTLNQRIKKMGSNLASKFRGSGII
jgi:hypothetical protein